MSSFNALTELEQLRLFMQERVQEFDESIDTSVGSSFDAEVIQPLLVRLGPDPYNTPIRAFILGRLRTEFPDLVLQDGEPLDDYAVKINQVLLEAFRRQIRQISLNQSLADPASLNEGEADNLAANYFQKRRVGGYAVGVARLYFSAPQFILVTPSNPVKTGLDLQFFPVENQSISADRMLFNEEDGLFFFDIVARSEAQGSEYNIDPNTLVRVDGIPNAVKVTNKIKFEEGLDREDTEEFIARIERSLTEKSLVTTRGINARLLEVFDNVRLIQVIGYGDPEMNRDILTAEGTSPPYSVAFGSTPNTGGSGTTFFDHNGTILLTGSGLTVASWPNIGSSAPQVGDIVQVVDEATPSSIITKVKSIVSAVRLEFDDLIADNISSPNVSVYLMRPDGNISISDIPGGILEPETLAGTIEIVSGEVHIGGALDTFVRGGDPQERNITLEGILDAEPLHFGVDLESFGSLGANEQFAHITEDISTHAAVPTTDRYGNSLGGTNDEVVIRTFDDSGADDFHPWHPTEDDVGRYVQLLGGNGGPDFGTYEITEFLGYEYFEDSLTNPYRAGRIKIDLNDQESGSPLATLTATPDFDLQLRLVEKVSIEDRVRDRDGSTVVIGAPGPDIVGGINFSVLGATIGDSVVIETGDDAGIYSIRRILSWLADGDTLILDRDLTQTVTPTGSGDGSGLRYRIADELNVDLVQPRVPKIPLGTVFLGGDLSTVAGSPTVIFTGTTNLLLAGVEEGDTLEILEGDNRGTYSITGVTGTTAELDAAPPNTQGNLEFEIYRAFTGIDRPMVRVDNIELLDSNSQPTGITIPYGDVIDARVLGVLSNRAEGKVVESFTGALQDNGQGLIDLYDVNVDFGSEDVKAGYRINILAGQSIGGYTIKYLGPDVPVGEGGPLSVNHMRVEPFVDGGQEWFATETPVHYSVGVASAGFVRLYFQEPTSVEILTGLAGGRLVTEDGNKEFRFSEVEGHTILPAGASGEDNPRDIRSARVRTTGTAGEFNTLLELTDPTRPGVFELELQDDDIVEVNEEIEFKDSSGNSFSKLGVFGSPAGLRTVTGSNLVSVPANSLIDFDAMNLPVNGGPIEGQIIIIESGPDAGQYTIEEVVSTKTLRLSAVMTSLTHSIKGRDINARSGVSLSTSGTKIDLEDTDDSAQLYGAVGEFITLFESLRGDIDGTYEISDLLAGDPNSIEIDHRGEFSDPTPVIPFTDPLSVGDFSWVRTEENTNVEQPFHIYQAVPTQLSIIEVASKRTDVVTGPRRCTLTTPATLTDADGGFTIGAKQGDMIEILEGPAAGIYFIDTDTTGAVATIFSNPPFPISASNIPYRIWGGLHGSRRMVTVGPFESDNGKVTPGYQLPYRVLRPGVARTSSTEMQDNFDDFLYYVDLQIESQGSGDDLNLERGLRLVVTSGVRVDGYTYTVENENLTFSVYEEVSLNFDRRFLPVGNSDSPENLTEVSGRNLRVFYESSTLTRLVNNLMRSDRDRPINAAPIARHFLPSFLLVSMTYSGGVSTAEVGQEMEDYVNSLGALDEVEVSDLEAFLTRRGATSIKHPIGLVTVTHDLGRKLVVNRSENKLGGLNEVPYNGTGRISAFFTKLNETLTLVRES